MRTVIKEAAPVDWNTHIRDEALFEMEGGNKLIPYEELRRIGEIRGIKSLVTTIIGATPVYAAASTTIIGKDGTVESGCACAGAHNVADVNFQIYPVAMAEVRAKSRALRSWLKINICSKEEVSNLYGSAPDPMGPIFAHQADCINNMCKTKGLKVSTILSMGSRKGIEKVADLRVGEASDIIAGLNNGTLEKLMKKKKKGGG